MKEKYNRNLDFEEIFGSLIVNTLMRFVGLVMRLCAIVIGLVFWLAILVVGLIGFISWLLAPFVYVIILVVSIITFIK